MARKKKPQNAKAQKTLKPVRAIFRKVVTSRIFKSLLGIFLIIAMLPVFFTFIYAIPGTAPVSTLMMGRILTGKKVERQWVEIENVAPVLTHSIIMSEDGQFCFHSGVDWKELNTVIDNALDGEKTRGASTLAMQTVKNLFLWPHRSFLRKVFEVPYAIFADLIWSKRRLMELYINIAEWDEGVFGVEAASRHYFNRSAAKLTRRQAALLTVSLPNPKRRNPAKPNKSLSRLAQVVENRAKQSGAYIKCLEP
ncbi:MAG: monofunctional biosynthetic peptidoglycan transglycosylase [Salaquimonas sp.]